MDVDNPEVVQPNKCARLQHFNPISQSKLYFCFFFDLCINIMHTQLVAYMRYMTEKKRIEEAYNSVNEWVNNDVFSAAIGRELNADIDDNSRTQWIAEEIGSKLHRVVMSVLEGRGPSVGRGTKVSVMKFDGRGTTPLRGGPGSRDWKMAAEAFNVDDDRACYEFADSVLANRGSFKIGKGGTVILNPGLYRARASSKSRGDDYVAEVRLERQVGIPFATVPHMPTRSPEIRVPFHEPLLPESKEGVCENAGVDNATVARKVEQLAREVQELYDYVTKA